MLILGRDVVNDSCPIVNRAWIDRYFPTPSNLNKFVKNRMVEKEPLFEHHRIAERVPEVVSNFIIRRFHLTHSVNLYLLLINHSAFPPSHHLPHPHRNQSPHKRPHRIHHQIRQFEKAHVQEQLETLDNEGQFKTDQGCKPEPTPGAEPLARCQEIAEDILRCPTSGSHILEQSGIIEQDRTSDSRKSRRWASNSGLIYFHLFICLPLSPSSARKYRAYSRSVHSGQVGNEPVSR